MEVRALAGQVDHPSHYMGSNGIECVDVLRGFLTVEEFRGAAKAQAVQYILRERGKGGNEDIEKARWWLGEIVKGAHGLGA